MNIKIIDVQYMTENKMDDDMVDTLANQYITFEKNYKKKITFYNFLCQGLNWMKLRGTKGVFVGN